MIFLDFARALALEYASRGIRVNAVSPGATNPRVDWPAL
jgi:NAD(P)-dependent dehydrogenase (short-subunit alcohol dehydrogenase family)